MFSRFMEGLDPTEFTLREKATFLAQGVISGKIFELAKPANRSFWKDLSGHFARPEVKAMLAEATDGVPEPERRALLLQAAAKLAVHCRKIVNIASMAGLSGASRMYDPRPRALHYALQPGVASLAPEKICLQLSVASAPRIGSAWFRHSRG
jgi:hypothetical protein